MSIFTSGRRQHNTWQFMCLVLAFIVGFAVASDDFYDLLKVSRDADTSQIKKAFRKASLEFHPDKNPGKF